MNRNLNKREKVIPENLTIKDVYQNYYTVARNKDLGVYSSDYSLIVPVKYDDIIYNDYGIIVNLYGKFGLYSYNGKLIVAPIYDEVIPSAYGIKIVRDGKYGAYSWKGRCIIQTDFSYINLDKNIIYVAKDNLFYGIYSYKGECIFPTD